MMDSENAGAPEEAVPALVQQGRFREALQAFDDLASTSTGAPPADIEYAAAIAAARLGALNRAAGLGESAWSRFHAAADQDGAMRAANLLGGIAFERGQLQAAEARFEETIRRAQELTDATMAARASNNLASLMHLQGKGGLAQSLYRSALLVYNRDGDRRGVAQTTHNLALAYRADGRSHEAYETHERAVAAGEQQDDDALLGLTLLGRVEAGLDLGNRSSAEADLRRARRLVEGTGDEVGVGDTERLEGWLEFKGRRYESALRHAQRGWNIAIRVESPQLRGECASLAAQAFRALKRHDQAEQFRSSAIAAFRSLGAVVLLRRFVMDWAA